MLCAYLKGQKLVRLRDCFIQRVLFFQKLVSSAHCIPLPFTSKHGTSGWNAFDWYLGIAERHVFATDGECVMRSVAPGIVDICLSCKSRGIYLFTPPALHK